MSQKSRILSLLKAHPEGVSCGELSRQGLYHSAAKRIFEARREGFDIEFIDAPAWNEAKYVLTGHSLLSESGSHGIKVSPPEEGSIPSDPKLSGTSGNGISSRSAEVPKVWLDNGQAEMRI